MALVFLRNLGKCRTGYGHSLVRASAPLGHRMLPLGSRLLSINGLPHANEPFSDRP